MALAEVLGIVGERFHGRALRIGLGLQQEDVFQRCAPMLANIPRRSPTSIQ